MNAEEKLNCDYENKAIYTSGFYADPQSDLANRQKLFDALKSLTMNQEPTTPFSLQIMATNSEINIMPLGLLDLNELKEYEKKQRASHGLNRADDGTPLLVQYSPHVEDASVSKQIIGTTEQLFADFNGQIEKIWQAVKQFLDENFKVLTTIEADLIADSKDVYQEYHETFTKMTAAQREEKLGFTLDDGEVEQFCRYMADMHEVQAVVLSAASFANRELLGDNSFTEMMSDNVRRSTVFWVLDNTFYEIFYYFLMAYQDQHDKLAKYLNHQRQTLIVNMRNDAFARVQKLTETPQLKVDFNKYFTDIFIPVAEQLTAEVNKFKD
ncbi:hypothetical protein [Limosilactobacillus caccae]|uniref:hypothetical protein n=1 Tax=Limosilactobacillus caccae TaxID=1926284 RepID=UPI000970AB99|nr:hypothetical protein [Limosilactobacillus caccae]